MNKNRLESFSDGVLAIIITIMVLSLPVPHSADITALYPVIPIFLGYVISFTYVGIYWNNHHHLLKTVTNVTGEILWGNLILLFWISLLPFTTAWMALNHFATWPTILYGVILLLASIFFYILQKIIIKTQGEDSLLKKALKENYKGKLSIIGYLLAIFLALYSPHLAQLIYVIIAIVWLIPDRRIEKTLN